jgi:transposase InsO family protein
LFVLADLAGGAWPEKARSAAITLSGHDQENDPVGTLFMDILLLFITAKADRLFSRDLLAGLKSFPGRPWTALRNGKEVTDMWLSHKLRPYGVSPKTLRIGCVRGRGYVKSDFADLYPLEATPSGGRNGHRIV